MSEFCSPLPPPPLGQRLACLARQEATPVSFLVPLGASQPPTPTSPGTSLPLSPGATGSRYSRTSGLHYPGVGGDGLLKPLRSSLPVTAAPRPSASRLSPGPRFPLPNSPQFPLSTGSNCQRIGRPAGEGWSRGSAEPALPSSTDALLPAACHGHKGWLGVNPSYSSSLHPKLPVGFVTVPCLLFIL